MQIFKKNGTNGKSAHSAVCLLNLQPSKECVGGILTQIFGLFYIFSKTNLSDLRFWVQRVEQRLCPIFFYTNSYALIKVKFSNFDHFSKLFDFLKNYPPKSEILFQSKGRVVRSSPV